MLLQIVIYGLVPLLAAFYIWGRRQLNKLQERGVPCLKPTFLLGNMAGVGTKRHLVEQNQMIYEAFKRKDKIAGNYTAFRANLMLLDLDLIKNVLIRDFNNFTDRGVYYNEGADPVSAHMFCLEGEQWKFIRTKLSPTFTSGKIRNMFATVVEISSELIGVIESGKEFETRDLCNRYVCDVIGNVALGLDCGSLKNETSELLEASDKIFRPGGFEFVRFFFVNSFMDFSRKLNLRLMNSKCSKFFIETVKQAIKHREENDIQRKDFLNSLIQLMKTGTIDGENVDDDKKLTFNQIVAEAFLFFFAGFETSATTMSFALFELADNPDIQAKARREIETVLARNDGKFTYESISEMNYLNQIFNETLRKYSPVGVLARCAKEAYIVSGTKHIIEKGQQLWIPVYAIHNDEDIYPSPERFDPDRFTPDEIAKRHNFAFIPFGEGPRNCIGMRFAQLQTKYSIAKILSEFELSVNEKTVKPLKMKKSALTMMTEGGIWIDYKKIEADEA